MFGYAYDMAPFLRPEVATSEEVEIDDLNILAVEFHWTHPYRRTARLRIEYLADTNAPKTLVLYGETAISAYQTMREGGRTEYET